MSAGFPYFVSTDAQELEALRGKSTLAFILGGVLIVVGLLALAYPHAATLETTIFFGVILMIGGVVQLAGAVVARGWKGSLLHCLVGLLTIFVGVVFIERPGITAAVWTLLLAVFLVGAGLVRVVVSLSLRFSGWGWAVLNGAITLLLGVLIWRHWPGDGLWVIGMLVGIELLFGGWSLVMLGLAARTLSQPPPPPA
jgi:uncharacterized membrane protein HdeD (DUF308 family)